MRPWHTAAALSLDIVAGGVSGGLLAVHVTSSVMPPAWWFLLPAAIWIVYTWDHLMDARRVGLSARSLRHQVHARHFNRLLAVSVGLAVSACLAALVWLPARLLVPGLVLAVVVAWYLVGSQAGRSGPRWKEPVAGLLYTTGIWFGPLCLADEIRSPMVLCLVLFAMAAVLNLLVCSLFEITADRDEGHASFALAWGPERVELLARILGLGGVGLAAVSVVNGPAGFRAAFAILGILLAGTLLILSHPRRFRVRDRYRLFGDLLFLLPALPAILDRIR